MSTTSQETIPPLAGIRYPAAGLRKWFFRMPLILWRMGLSWALPHQFLVLTTTGRKSGKPRHTMVEHWELDGDYYVTSGWGKHAQWLKNLQADPIVTVQTSRQTPVVGHAELVQDDERLVRFYNHAMGTSPFWKPYLDSLEIEHNVEDFVAKKERLSVIRIQPVDQVGPAALPTDLAGIWALVLLGLVWLLRPRRQHT